MTAARTKATLLGLALAALVLAGCATTPTAVSPGTKVDTPELQAARQKAGIAPCAPGTAAPVSGGLPALTLPCLGGGEGIDLSKLPRPAVIQLWASWCDNCPHELPLYQRLYAAAGDKLTVLGIDYEDTNPGRGLELLQQAGVKFPQVADTGGALSDTYRIQGLPGILIIDAQGKVTFRLRLIDTYADLVALVEQYAGIRV